MHNIQVYILLQGNTTPLTIKHIDMEIKNATKSHYIPTPTPKCDSFMIICAININQSDPNMQESSRASDNNE